jgi:hypothetical protein
VELFLIFKGAVIAVKLDIKLSLFCAVPHPMLKKAKQKCKWVMVFIGLFYLILKYWTKIIDSLKKGLTLC